MRGAPQAKSIRLPPSLPSVQWSSLITRQQQRRRARTLDHLEQIKRLQREHRRQSSLGKGGLESSHQWIRRF